MTTWQSIIYVYNVQMSKGENGSPYIHALICVLILEAKPIWAKLAKKKLLRKLFLQHYRSSWLQALEGHVMYDSW